MSLNSFKFKIGYIQKFFQGFNVSNEYGNYTFAINEQIKTEATSALTKLKGLKFEVENIEISDSDFTLLNKLSIEMLTYRESCVIACIKDAINGYIV